MTSVTSSSTVQCRGHGSPTLICVHGGGCDHRDWQAQVDALSTLFRVVTFDLPGHGEAERPDTATIAHLARVTADVKDRHGNGHVVLIGHSLGCRVVLECYRRSRSDIDALVFVDGSYFGDDDADIQAIGERMSELGMPSFLKALFEEMFPQDSNEALRERLIARGRQWDPAFGRNLILDMVRWDRNDAEQVLAEVGVPVLLLQSTGVDESFRRISLEDGMTTPWTDLVQGKVAGAELQVVPGVGHFLQIEAADAVNRHISEFAARLCTVGQP
jgi:pimeloyl-ACP methyl ester carboxylesterase